MAPSPIRPARVKRDWRFRLVDRNGRAPRETRIASQRTQMMRRSISIAEASGLPAWDGLRAPSLRLMALPIGLARPLESVRARFGARNLVEVEQHLDAVDQVAQELLGDAGAALARDRLLQLFELLLHEVMHGDARAVERALAR